MDERIMPWYTAEFPDDDLGREIDPQVTFSDVLEHLHTPVRHRRSDVYELLGVGDSFVRERVFRRLSELLGTSYNHVYGLWFNPPRRDVI